MDKLLFAICILIYSVVVFFLALKERETLKNVPTVVNKLYTVACVVIFFALFICSTSTIKDGATITFRDMNGEGFSVGGLIGYAFFGCFFLALYGGILTALLFIPHTVYIFVKYPNTTVRSKLPASLDVDMWSSFYAVGSAVAYHLILYAFSLTDVFIPLFGF